MAGPDRAPGANSGAHRAILEGLRNGDIKAVLLLAGASGIDNRRPFDPDRIERYAARRARRELRQQLGETPDHLGNAHRILARLNPRDWNYMRRARGVVRLGRGRFGLTEEQGGELLEEAKLARWRAKNGLEYRFLVAPLMAPDAAPEAFYQIQASDFLSWPYAWLFETWKKNGILGAAVRDRILAGRRNIPKLSPDQWAVEARETTALLLARRSRWGSEAGRSAKIVAG